MELVSVAFTPFLVMDPLGNIPLFLSVPREVPPERRRRILVRELLIAYAVLLTCLFIGPPLMRSLKLDQESISIAGGIVLFLIALRMIFPSEGGVMGETVEGEPFIVPLAIPLLAGPSALSAILFLVSTAPERTPAWIGALTLAWAASAAILLSSNLFYRVLRRRGLVPLERLMGMVLVIPAVQMLFYGLALRASTPCANGSCVTRSARTTPVSTSRAPAACMTAPARSSWPARATPAPSSRWPRTTSSSPASTPRRSSSPRTRSPAACSASSASTAAA